MTYRGSHIFHLLKTYNFLKNGIDNRILSPFKYHSEHDIQVDYFYSEHDTEYASFMRWLKKKIERIILIYIM